MRKIIFKLNAIFAGFVLTLFFFQGPFVDTVKATAPVATVNAASVSSGQFGANTGGGAYSFPGWVGIGVLAPSSPSLAMEVGGTAAFNSSLITRQGIFDYGDFDLTAPGGFPSRWRLRNWDGVGFQIFQVYDYSGLSGNLVNLPRVTVDGTGNVGVGTNVPGEKLEVNGGVRLNSSNPQPACTTAKQGVLWFTKGASGVKDSLQVCAKDASDAFAWRILY